MSLFLINIKSFYTTGLLGRGVWNEIFQGFYLLSEPIADVSSVSWTTISFIKCCFTHEKRRKRENKHSDGLTGMKSYVNCRTLTFLWWSLILHSISPFYYEVHSFYIALHMRLRATNWGSCLWCCDGKNMIVETLLSLLWTFLMR